MANAPIDSAGLELPYSLEAEQSVLGAALIDGGVIARVLDFLKPEHFYRAPHQALFAIMVRQFMAGETTDYVTVLEAAQREEVFATPDEAKLYLVKLAQIVPSTANVEAYAHIVQERFFVRSLILAAKEIETRAQENGENAGELLDWAEQRIYEIRQGREVRGLRKIGDIMVETYDHLQKISGPDKDLYKGLSTSFSELDRVLVGMNDSDLILVAGRPGMGKTTFAINIAQDLAVRQRKRVAIFSLEMSGEQLVTRMLSSAASISSTALRSGTMDASDWVSLAASADELSKAPVLIDDTAGITVPEMKARLRRVRDLGAVFIDYLQLMSTGGKHSDNRVLEVSEITRSLKIMAKELMVPVILCSQLSRGPESRTNHRPMLSDLRESGSIEQDADIVLFLYREGYYDEDKGKDTAECIIAKNRHGETGTVNLTWSGQYSRFGSIDPVLAQVPVQQP